MIRRIVRVRGRVQGVGFRMAAEREARRLGLAGTVRNLFDGSVEADIEGEDAAVQEMLDWLAEGPPTARVDGTTVAEDEPRGATSFDVTG